MQFEIILTDQEFAHLLRQIAESKEMSNTWVNILKFAIAAIPAVEEIIPEPGQGEPKKQIILAGAEAILQSSAGVAAQSGNNDAAVILSATNFFIDKAVSIFNKFKLAGFKPSPVQPITITAGVAAGPIVIPAK